VTPAVSHAGPVWTLDLGSGENRFSPAWMDAVDEALDQLEKEPEPAVLVTTATGKFFSNGLDLDWLREHPDQYKPYVERVERLFARVLTLPVPTVAAINGHAFGAGALIAMAHDYRVMREDRGFFCFPEVDIGLPFSPGMSALVTCKLTPRSAVDAMTTGHRFPAPAAVAAGLVDSAATADRVSTVAAELVRGLAGKDRRTLGTIKSTMFADVVEALHRPRES
jgi:enoyl-CoA hydratase/carnithine racemase